MQHNAVRRLRVFMNHLEPINNESPISHKTCSVERETIDPRKIFEIIKNELPDEEREKFLNKIASSPVLKKKIIGVTTAEYRKEVTQRVKYIMQNAFLDLDLLKKDPLTYLNKLEVLSMCNQASVMVKFGVQNILFGGTVLNLGTQKHIDKYLSKIMRLELPGCFAMTELAHGSNVRGLQTTATYDPEKQVFIINTPSKSAIKWWLGNAAVDGKMATVFARLITKGTDYGIHAFLVPIRDMRTHEPCPGVEIGDCGEKIGLHGVDNGWIKFNNVEIPRENLLNRFSDVHPDGTFTSSFKSEGRRFAALLGELLTGRVNIVSGSLISRMIASTIVTRYASSRTQFGPPKSSEIPILDYRSYQIRLIPIIVSCYATNSVKKYLFKRYAKLCASEIRDEEDVAEVHALASGLKAITSWDTQGYLNTLRELCGGHGYSAYNLLGELRNDHDILQTFEGDNTVLIQQTTYFLIKQYKNKFNGNQFSDMLTYFGEKAKAMVEDRNPVITRVATEKHLRSLDFQLKAFRYRTANLVDKCAMKLKNTKKKLGVFQSWNNGLPLIIAAGRAYIEQVTLEQFAETVNNIEDPEVQHVFKTMCDLYALSIIDKDIGAFRDVIKKNKASRIRALVVKLCAQLRTHALSLVNAFQIPEYVIDTPISRKDGNYEKHILDFAMDYTKQASSVLQQSEQEDEEENTVIEVK